MSDDLSPIPDTKTVERYANLAPRDEVHVTLTDGTTVAGEVNKCSIDRKPAESGFREARYVEVVDRAAITTNRPFSGAVHDDVVLGVLALEWTRRKTTAGFESEPQPLRWWEPSSTLRVHESERRVDHLEDPKNSDAIDASHDVQTIEVVR